MKFPNLQTLNPSFNHFVSFHVPNIWKNKSTRHLENNILAKLLLSKYVYGEQFSRRYTFYWQGDKIESYTAKMQWLCINPAHFISVSSTFLSVLLQMKILKLLSG